MNLNSKNETIDFFIVGFSDYPKQWILMFLIFLSVYILTLCGNLILIVVICQSPLVYTPMYFFLCNLAWLDIVYTSVTSPNLLHIFVTNNGRVSFGGCITQLYFFVTFWNTEYFLLTVMSYDRYVAISKPLHYTLVMNRKLCTFSAVGAWVGGLLGAISPTTVSSTASYHAHNIINHFFCDISALEKLAISGTTQIRAVIITQGLLLVMTCFLLTLISYFYIIATILKIQSSKGKYKAFSTCASHLTVVCVFYILIFDLYLRPKSAISPNEGKILTVLYVYIIPLLNPIIYSFRNKDVIGTLKKMFTNIIVIKNLKIHNH